MKAAIYVRLSREDREKNGAESESIVNQQMMLLDYCKQQSWEVYKVYSDEDYSGSDRERPRFCEMLKAAEERKFDIVLTKTQSRFARDMEIIEKYVNTLFPIWGIRFISLVDNADSENQSNRKARQIGSLVDQWYLEDVSANIKATLSSKRKAGLWVGAFAPFGYIKDPQNKNHLIVDEDAAVTVRYIFKCYLNGYGITTIARKLNQEGVVNPATYKKNKGQPFQNKNKECSSLWHHYSVRRILTNQVYIGDTVQGITENISYKSNKKRKKPKSRWDIVKNTHQPIIDNDTFFKVQEILSERRRSDNSGSVSLFANKIRCMKCGASMRSQVTGGQRYYTCHRHYLYPEACEGTYVSANTLTSALIKELSLLYNTYLDEDEAEKRLFASTEYERKIKALKNQIQNITNKIEKVECRFKHLYYDKIDGLLTDDDFKLISAECKDNESNLKQTLQGLQNEYSSYINNKEQKYRPGNLISKYKDIKILDRYTVELLVNYIEVGGNKQNRILRIHWNF